jgi:hypothetical protein
MLQRDTDPETNVSSRPGGGRSSDSFWQPLLGGIGLGLFFGIVGSWAARAGAADHQVFQEERRVAEAHDTVQLCAQILNGVPGTQVGRLRIKRVQGGVLVLEP